MNAPVDSQAASAHPRVFQLAALRIDPDAGEATGPGGCEKLDPKVMDVLLVLAKNGGHVVRRADLLAQVWPNVVVTDEVLSRCIYELRRQLALAGGDETYKTLIETIPKRGYRLNDPTPPLSNETAEVPKKNSWRRAAAWAAVASAVAVLAIVTLWPERPAYSIAVLPFVDMSANKDQGYFSDGTTEEILNRLSQSPDLRVIARTSSFTFRDRPLNIPQIARRLDVTHVLEGSVRKEGDRVRVTAQLIAASDGSHVWSETYDRTLGDVFAIQDDIAVAVSNALQLTLAVGGPSARQPANIDAYDLVLRGEYFYSRRAVGDIELSIKLFEDAVRVDPTYARAWADLAGAYSFEAWSTEPPSRILQAKQGQAALKAVQLDPSSGIAHRRLAQFYGETGDADNRDRHTALSRTLAPDEPMILVDRAWDSFDRGDHDAGIALQRRAVQRDPVNGVGWQLLGLMQIVAGRLDEALDSYRSLMEINPDAGPDAAIEISRILVMQSKYNDAAAAAMELPPGKYRDQALVMLVRSPSHRKEAEEALRRMESYVPVPPLDAVEHTNMDSIRLAEAYAYRGMNDRAFERLERKAESLKGNPEAEIYLWNLRHEARLAPFLNPLRSDPRWKAFVAEKS